MIKFALFIEMSEKTEIILIIKFLFWNGMMDFLKYILKLNGQK